METGIGDFVKYRGISRGFGGKGTGSVYAVQIRDNDNFSRVKINRRTQKIMKFLGRERTVFKLFSNRR